MLITFLELFFTWILLLYFSCIYRRICDIPPSSEWCCIPGMVAVPSGGTGKVGESGYSVGNSSVPSVPSLLPPLPSLLPPPPPPSLYSPLILHHYSLLCITFFIITIFPLPPHLSLLPPLCLFHRYSFFFLHQYFLFCPLHHYSIFLSLSFSSVILFPRCSVPYSSPSLRKSLEGKTFINFPVFYVKVELQPTKLI